MKRSFVNIRWSEIPKDEWLKIVLVSPGECTIKHIPHYGLYISYKAFFPMLTDKRVFDFTFPYNRFTEAINAIPPSLRQNLAIPYQFEFRKGRKGSIEIRDWREYDGS